MIKVQDFSKCIKNKNKCINYNKLSPQDYFRMNIIGPSGSGKTWMMLSMVLNDIHFDKIYVFAKDLEEPLYIFLKDFFKKCKNKIEKITNKSCPEIAYFSSSLEDIPDVDDLDKTKQNLIIFDDFVNEKDQNFIEDLFIRGRKKHTSIIYLSQSYFKTPKIVRLNSEYFALFNICDKKELRSIADTHSTKISYDSFMNLYKQCMREKYQFLLIDNKTQFLPMHIRCGWSKLLSKKILYEFEEY
jgi:hypothetical protein